jgi:hypothetical protein
MKLEQALKSCANCPHQNDCQNVGTNSLVVVAAASKSAFKTALFSRPTRQRHSRFAANSIELLIQHHCFSRLK